MGKFISLGEYNKLYKYIWIYLIIRFVSTFTFDNELIFDQFHTDLLDIPWHPFISLQFFYIAFIIISLILIIIKKVRQKKEFDQDLTEGKLIYNKTSIESEYGVEQSDYFLFVNLFFVVIADLFEETVTKFQCSMFRYWMFEMFFFEIICSKLLKTKIYKHHIYSFVFILSFCSLIKSIVTIIYFVNDTDNVKIFENRKWLIPTAIIVFLLYYIFKAYIYCNEKYYLEKRVISIRNYLLFYGIFGIIASSICAIISTYVPCGDNTIPEFSKIVCSYKDDNNIYYFDSYSIYFKKLSSEFFGVKILFIIIGSILYYASNYYIYVIYKRLSPIYHICMNRLNVLILTILGFINDLINNDNLQKIDISIGILNIINLLFYVLGSTVYLEFIELNFCDLNFYTKRKIRERANTDIRISLGDISVNSEVEE